MLNTHSYKLFLSVALMVLMALTLSCSGKNSDAPSANKVHAENWYNPQYVKDASFHGTKVKAEGELSCMKCHETNGRGIQTIPGCYTCHFGAEGSKTPAGSDWTHGLSGHKQYQDDQTVCNACHEVGRSFVSSPGICHNCHGSGENHVMGQVWLDKNNAQFHGIQPQQDCATCHNLAVDCNQCHFDATGSKTPDIAEWLHGNNDGHKVYSSENPTCQQCHTLNRTFGSEPSSCHDCHDIETHVLGRAWLDKNDVQFHGGQPQQDCVSCHNLAADCNQCHFDAQGDKAPIGSVWLHGNNAEHKDYGNQNATCQQCHTLNRSYGNDPTSCHDCHEIENHVVGQAWLDKNNAQFHGDQPQQDCASCHNLASECSQCHFDAQGGKAPVGSGWLHGNNTEHKVYESQNATCQQCHTVNRSYGNDPTSCHDCHEIETHVVGQAWLAKSSPQFHGDQPQQDCASCHNLAADCNQCHFDAQGSKAPVGSGWLHGNNAEHKVYESQNATCQQCHTLNRSYGTDPTSCHDCHEIETHVVGQAWLDKDNAQFHGDQPQQDCASCHNLASECNQCHFNAQGSKAPVGSGWQHGNNTEHKDYENQNATCQQCHTLNRSYGNDPTSCHDCHAIETHAMGRDWLDSSRSQYHGDQPQQDCSSCHNLSTECNQCHFGSTGSKAPLGSSWPHGRKDNHNDQKKYNLVCDECHTLTKAYRNEPGNCHTCH